MNKNKLLVTENIASISVFVIPVWVILIFPNLKDFWIRYLIYGASFLVILTYIFFNKTYKKFSFLGHWENSLKWNSIVVLVCGLLTTLIYTNNWYPKDVAVYSDRGFGTLWFIIFYFFISSPLQEILFRGFLFEVLDKFKISTNWVILVSSLIYSNFHLYFIQPQLIFILTFILGLFWGWDYSKNKSLLTISLSHAILGIMAFLLNLA